MLWRIDEFVLFFLANAVYLMFIEVGFRLGRKSGGRGDDDVRNHVGALQAATLLLLALLLGFTFAMAVSRFDTRKALVVEEANAIGTTLLRARFLPESQRREVAELLEEYVSVRLAFYQAGIDPQRLQAASDAAARLDTRLWAVAVAVAARAERSVPVGLFIQSLNDLIDDNEKRRVALENHVPESVILLLFIVSCVALGFVAYGCGLTGRRHFVMNAIFAMLIAMVITVIMDIDRPRRGLVTVSQDSMVRLRATLDATAP
jgi:hypothetical protein